MRVCLELGLLMLKVLGWGRKVGKGILAVVNRKLFLFPPSFLVPNEMISLIFPPPPFPRFLWKFAQGTLKVYKTTGRNNYVALCEPGYISFGGG